MRATRAVGRRGGDGGRRPRSSSGRWAVQCARGGRGRRPCPRARGSASSCWCSPASRSAAACKRILRLGEPWRSSLFRADTSFVHRSFQRRSARRQHGLPHRLHPEVRLERAHPLEPRVARRRGEAQLLGRRHQPEGVAEARELGELDPRRREQLGEHHVLALPGILGALGGRSGVASVPPTSTNQRRFQLGRPLFECLVSQPWIATENSRPPRRARLLLLLLKVHSTLRRCRPRVRRPFASRSANGREQARCRRGAHVAARGDDRQAVTLADRVRGTYSLFTASAPWPRAGLCGQRRQV